ncbi:uncharacterized protein LOC111052135 isoform X2 [Nilaparvata lugens]|uniref:uncharacterized protein LOC111052135 isoform X2 n=1 Tax=Nilaparvata lugens TaxID=108931 RepID=UPI00193E3A77|nr:uncharacterized protein LOC111052135 isoform X2 [Nilaparvata lugens]
MVNGETNHGDSKKKTETLFLKRINRWKVIQKLSSKKKNLSHLDILENDHLSLWTSYPVHYFMKTIGITPMNCRGENISIKFTVPYLIYSCLLLLIYTTVTLLFMLDDSFRMHFLTVFPLLTSSLTIYWNLILSLDESRKLCQIAGKLFQINRMMCGRRCRNHFPKGSTFILLVAVVLSSIIFYIDIPSIPVTVYIVFVKSHLAFVIVQLYEMHQKLKCGFEEVNRNLVRIVDRYDSQIFTVNSILPFVEVIGNTDNYNHITIPVLIDLHWTLCKTVTTVGELLCFKVLLVMFNSSARMISVTFFFIDYWMDSDEKEINLEIICRIIRKVVKITTCLIEILLPIVPCVLTAREAKKTPVVISELMNKDLPTKIRKQLERSIKLLKLHNAETSVNGLLKFDLSIMTTIAGFATSYLLIFVQHEASLKSFVNTNKNETQS